MPQTRAPKRLCIPERAEGAVTRANPAPGDQKAQLRKAHAVGMARYKAAYLALAKC